MQPFLQVGHGARGRGVFARRDVPAATLIESCPVVLLPRSEVGAGHLAAYVFLWGGEAGDRYALPVGHGLLFNHDPRPNARFEIDEEGRRVDFYSIGPIAAGAEVVIDYDYDPDHLALLEHPEWYRGLAPEPVSSAAGETISGVATTLWRWRAGEVFPPGVEDSLRGLLVGCFGAGADEPLVDCDWRWLLLEGGRRPIAHAAVRRMEPPDSTVGHLAYAATEPALRRRGLASRLLGQVQEDAASLGLSALVLQAEQAAVAFYCRLGWELVATRASFRDSELTDTDPVLAWSPDPRQVMRLRTRCFEFASDW